MNKLETFIKENKKSLLVSLAGSVVFTFVLWGVAGALIYANRDDIFASFLTEPSTEIKGEPVDPVEEESRIVSVIDTVNPAVVSIVVMKEVPVIDPRTRERGTEKREVGGGSGFFANKDGLVVTNRHVVADEKAEYTVFTNDGEKYEAEVLARDPLLDIAVLQTKANDTPYLEFSDSDKIKLGETVIAIGNALGEFRNSVSIGVVSGLSRSIVAGDNFGHAELLEQVIQTDAAINPGNSGGPLIDLDGKVVGMNVAVSRGAENIGFALPANIVKTVADSVAEHGEIVRPYLGVRYSQVTEALKEKNSLSVDYGVLVIRGETIEDLAVIPGSPADKAGIVENDIILEVDGEKLEEGGKSLALILRQKKVGDSVILKVLSKGKEKTVTVNLEKAPKS